MTASANLDLVRSILAAHERGDYSSADWAEIAEGPDPGVWKGRAAMAKAWRGVLTAYEDYRSVIDEMGEIDDERVLRTGTTPSKPWACRSSRCAGRP